MLTILFHGKAFAGPWSKPVNCWHRCPTSIPQWQLCCAFQYDKLCRILTWSSVSACAHRSLGRIARCIGIFWQTRGCSFQGPWLWACKAHRCLHLRAETFTYCHQSFEACLLAILLYNEVKLDPGNTPQVQCGAAWFDRHGCNCGWISRWSGQHYAKL